MKAFSLPAQQLRRGQVQALADQTRLISLLPETILSQLLHPTLYPNTLLHFIPIKNQQKKKKNDSCYD